MPDRSFVTLTGHITCYRHTGRKPVAMRAVPSYDQLADKVSKWEIAVQWLGCCGKPSIGIWKA